MIVSQSLYHLASILHHGVQGKIFYLENRLGCSDFLFLYQSSCKYNRAVLPAHFNAKHKTIYHPFVNTPLLFPDSITGRSIAWPWDPFSTHGSESSR